MAAAPKPCPLTDTTPVKEAGVLQDTYTLLRKLLKALGYHVPG